MKESVHRHPAVDIHAALRLYSCNARRRELAWAGKRERTEILATLNDSFVVIGVGGIRFKLVPRLGNLRKAPREMVDINKLLNEVI